jgi:hypothetical protein
MPKKNTIKAVLIMMSVLLLCFFVGVAAEGVVGSDFFSDSGGNPSFFILTLHSFSISIDGKPYIDKIALYTENRV